MQMRLVESKSIISQKETKTILIYNVKSIQSHIRLYATYYQLQNRKNEPFDHPDNE